MSNLIEKQGQINWTICQRLMLCSVEFMYEALVVVLGGLGSPLKARNL